MLHTFPVGYRFMGGTVDRYRQVGNAVPPSHAAAVGDAIRRAENRSAPIRENIDAVRSFAQRVLTRAVALVRRDPPRGVTPDDIDGFIERHRDDLRSQTAKVLDGQAA